VQDKIFNPFYTTRQEGTGLGLAVVAAVVRAHEGDIAVESEPDEGTSFILTLPVIDQDTQSVISESKESAAAHSPANKKLMTA
jgi:signal transduction histidine kinase